jgi:hypothetical protein
LGRIGGRRLGDNAVRVRAAGALAEYPHPTLNTVHLSRTVFTLHHATVGGVIAT